MNYPPLLSDLGSRPIKPTSLRPGDWLRLDGGKTDGFVILQNWPSLRKMEVKWVDCAPDVLDYLLVFDPPGKLILWGRGKKRRWHKWLPKWLAGRILPYSKPTRRHD